MKLRSIHFTRRDGSRLELSADEAKELYDFLGRFFDTPATAPLPPAQMWWYYTQSDPLFTGVRPNLTPVVTCSKST